MDANKKFTPVEVAESLLKCASPVPCEGCISIEHRGDCDCADWLKRTAAALIGELAAEVERLQAELIQRNDELLKIREENRWIPTSERLPQTDDGPFSSYEEEFTVQVLAVIEGAEWATTLYFDGYDFFDVQGGEAIPYRVSRWKPMPRGAEEKGGCDHGADCKSKIPL